MMKHNLYGENSAVAIIGSGPAGLMAAEVLSAAGIAVNLFDSMPSVGRKFLLAGVGGMNLTHSENFDRFLSRYSDRAENLKPYLRAFGAEHLREWAHQLGVETFIGSSGRVFPTNMKAAPLLRLWLHRLRANGVQVHVRHKWCGWNEEGQLRFSTPQGEITVAPAATIFAVGGGSWARLGTDGSWATLFHEKGVSVESLTPSNCGFNLNWSEMFRTKFSGRPVKSIVLNFTDAAGNIIQQQGEFNVTEHGVEGGLIYTLSAAIRNTVNTSGLAHVTLDLLPGKSFDRIKSELEKPRGSKSMANHLRTTVGIEGVKAGLLREVLSADQFSDTNKLANGIKSLSLKLISPRPIDEAISSAGGVAFSALNANLMLNNLSGVFCAGEMLDWEAPTGGYLLTACFSTGYQAGKSALAWLQSEK